MLQKRWRVGLQYIFHFGGVVSNVNPFYVCLEIFNNRTLLVNCLDGMWLACVLVENDDIVFLSKRY